MKSGLSMVSRPLLASVSLAMPTSPPASADPAFVVPRAELIAAIKSIGVMPVDVDDAVPNQEEVASRLEEDITTRLQRGGFIVVPPSTMRAIRERAQTTLGGVYDPMTGAPIRDRVEALQEFSQHEYRMLHPVDAILRANVIRRQARFALGSADWDGVRERVTARTGITGRLQKMLSALSTVADVPALSLAVRLVDPRGKTLYTGFGGLLVLDYYPTVSGSFIAYDLAAVDPKLALGDPSLAARAMAVALEPLATGAVPGRRLSFTLPPSRESPRTQTATLNDVLRGHRRITLASLEMPEPALVQRDRVQARYGDLLPARFTALGFEVVGGNDFEGLWVAECAAAGGLYDRFTGRADPTKLSKARAGVLAALRERYGASALVLPSIVSRTAPFREGRAKWDGVVESVTVGGMGFASIFLDRSLTYHGDLSAISLKLRILGDAGQVLFEGIGGIQLTSHLAHGRTEALPEPALFADPANDAVAIDVALGTLALPSTKGH